MEKGESICGWIIIALTVSAMSFAAVNRHDVAVCFAMVASVLFIGTSLKYGAKRGKNGG